MGIDPFDEGIVAASSGMSRDDNPYGEDTGPGQRWAEGFDSVEDRDEDGEYADPAEKAGI